MFFINNSYINFQEVPTLSESSEKEPAKVTVVLSSVKQSPVFRDGPHI